MKTHTKYKGLLSVEVVVAVSVLATIIAVLAALNLSFGKLNRHLWAKHTCLAAGQAQADSIAATGSPIDKSTFEKLWPGVTCKLETGNGEGQWQGLQRIDLTLSKKARQKTVQVRLTRYIQPVEGGAQ